MMFSWEKQKTPSLPPLILVSITTPESATMSIPSNSFTLEHRDTPAYKPSAPLDETFVNLKTPAVFLVEVTPPDENESRSENSTSCH